MASTLLKNITQKRIISKTVRKTENKLLNEVLYGNSLEGELLLPDRDGGQSGRRAYTLGMIFGECGDREWVSQITWNLGREINLQPINNLVYCTIPYSLYNILCH